MPRGDTYYVIKTFLRTRDGIIEGEAVQVRSAASACGYGKCVGGAVAGLIAFSRSRDPMTGEWQDATILGIYGDVPSEAYER